MQEKGGDGAGVMGKIVSLQDFTLSPSPFLLPFLNYSSWWLKKTKG
jgi:hypothetical protein